MAARNHVTKIMNTTGVVKGTDEIEQKAKAEVVKPDPTNPTEIIKKNTVANKKEIAKDIKEPFDGPKNV